MDPLLEDRANQQPPLRTRLRLALSIACGLVLVGCSGGAGSDSDDVQRSASGQDMKATSGEPKGGWEAVLPTTEECPEQEQADATPTQLRTSAICVIDHVREQRGLDVLTRSDELHESAQGKLQDMVRCNEFSHTACDRGVSYWYDQVGYVEDCRSGAYAENLGVGGGRLGSPQQIVLSWLESKGHRRNLLSDRWSEQAIAVERLDSWKASTGDSSTTYRDVNVWVSHFGVRNGC